MMEFLINAIRELDLPNVKNILESLSEYSVDKLSSSSAPLCEACRVNSSDIVELLLSHGFAVNAPHGRLNKHPIHFACDDADDRRDVVKTLLDAGADVNAKDDDGNTGLHLACTHSNVEVVRLLLESGADVTLVDIDDECPLLRACYSNQEEIIDLLLRYNAKPSGPCLMSSMTHDFSRGVSLLYNASPDIQLADFFGTLLRMKRMESRTSILQTDIDLDIEDTDILFPPLHCACSLQVFCSYKVVMSILEVRPDVHRRDDAWFNSLQHACSCVNLKVIQILLAYGVNAEDDDFHPMWKYCPGLSRNNFSNYLMTLKLLHAAGFRIDEESARMFVQAVEHASDISECDRDQFQDLVNTYRAHPLSLKGHARVKIRKRIPVKIDINIVKLHSVLPSNLINYLRFEDLIEPIPFE